MRNFLEKFELECESSVRYRFLLRAGRWERCSRKRVSLRKGLTVAIDWKIR